MFAGTWTFRHCSSDQRLPLPRHCRINEKLGLRQNIAIYAICANNLGIFERCDAYHKRGPTEYENRQMPRGCCRPINVQPLLENREFHVQVHLPHDRQTRNKCSKKKSGWSVSSNQHGKENLIIFWDFLILPFTYQCVRKILFDWRDSRGINESESSLKHVGHGNCRRGWHLIKLNSVLLIQLDGSWWDRGNTHAYHLEVPMSHPRSNGQCTFSRSSNQTKTRVSCFPNV